VLPRFAITFLDMGAGEFVAINDGSYEAVAYGSRINGSTPAVENYDGWATQFISEPSGQTIEDVTDPLSMTEDQQSGTMQFMFANTDHFVVELGRTGTYAKCCTKIMFTGASNTGDWPSCAPPPSAPPSAPPPF